MRYVIATHCFALKTDALETEDQLRSFWEFCEDKHEEYNGDSSEYVPDYSRHDPTGKRLFIEHRDNWDKTELDRLIENGAYPECTLVIVVPDTAPVPREVLEKMDKYEEFASQNPSKRTAELGRVHTNNVKIRRSWRS